MEIQGLRRKKLRKWIGLHCNGSVNRFAVGVDYKQPQIAETLNGKRSFGEKLARSLEEAAKMPPGYLDKDDDVVPEPVREPKQLDAITLTQAP